MRIAVIAHVYYPELWDELATCILHFPQDAIDLFVTTPHVDDGLRRNVLTRFPNATYTVVENRGYDVAPFLSVLNRIDTDRYDYIAKLHTKRDVAGWCNYIPFVSGRWRKCLLSFCSSSRCIRKSLDFLEQCPNVGMVSHPAVIVSRGDFEETEDIRKRAESVVRKLGLNPGRRCYVAGTMFLARMSCLKVLHGSVRFDDFEMSSGEDSMKKIVHASGLAHVYERVFGYLVTAQGMNISDVNRLVWMYDVGYWLRMPLFYFVRALYRALLKPIREHGNVL